MSSSFQKPENALKRAEELIGIGKQTDALETLHLAIQHRKWRNNWTVTIERIMVRHLELCVELKRMRTAREGLHQYRSTCQAANIKSLELVVQVFRQAAETKVNEAKEQQEIMMSEMEDLDEMEAPQTILLRAIQAHDTRQQSQDRDVHAHFRFLWEAYRVILDVLKSSSRLEEVYHETAQHAFDFCRANKRPQEFKRLCDTLRKNFQDLSKRSPDKQMVNPSNPETIMRTIETRFAQMRTATELDLWREAYNTATEIFELMNKAKTKPKTRSEYYEFLGQIFWKSENYLFHAFACLKNVLYVKAVKRDLSKEDLCSMASKAVMATLCVPFQRSSESQTTLELTTEGSSSPYEKAKKHATLFNAQSVPTRDTIIGQLIEKNLLQHAAEPCQKLFALIESDFTPLSLCQDAKPFLDIISDETEKVCDGKLLNYITPVKKIIFFRLMKQLSEVYANMTIDNFERAASIVPFSLAEKWMANAAQQQGINIQINYREKAIVFGATRKVDMKSMRQPLIEIGHKLQQAMQRVAPEEQHKKEKLEKQELAKNIVRRIDEERGLIRQRREEIERRKEESEKRKELAEREAMEKIRKQEAKEAEDERQRLQAERHRREIEREEQKKKDAKQKETQALLEAMKKQDENKPTNLKIGNKKLQDIQAEDIADISFDQIEMAREAQVKRERAEKIRQRKLENKRVDHLSRAMREEAKKQLDDWAEEIQRQDDDLLDAAQDRDEEEQRNKHAAELKEKEMLIAYQEAKDEWVEEQLSAKYEEHMKKVKEKRQSRMQEEVEAKIDRARKRVAAAQRDEQRRKEDEKKAEETRQKRAAEEKRRAEEEKREAERLEEEERRREEEEARKKEEKEARDAKRKEEDERRERADKMRRDKEREIEERQEKERAGGGRDGDDRRRNDRGGDRDERGGGGWRDRPPKEDRGGGDGWRDRRDDDRGGRAGGDEGAKPMPWRRNQQPQRSEEDEGGWRKDAAEPRKNDAGPEARRGGGSAWGRDDRDDRADREEKPPREEKPSAWGKGGARRDADEEDRRPAARRDPEPKARPPAAADDDDDFQAVTSKKKGKAKEAAPEPSAEPEEDDGFQAVTTKKKKKDRDAPAEDDAPAPSRPWGKGGGGAGGGGAANAPWRRNAPTDAGDDDGARRPATRDDWKNRGKEDAPESAAKAPAPWRRGAGASGGGGGGADGGSWR